MEIHGVNEVKWIVIGIMITAIFFGGEERDLADSVIGLIDRTNVECVLDQEEE